MMAKMKLGRKLLEMLFIVVLGLVSVAMLLAAQSYAAPAVKRFQMLRLRTNILAAAGIAVAPATVNQVFEDRVTEARVGDATFYRADSLVVYEFKGRGLWGPIEGVITLDSGLTRIKSVRVLVQEETPGLGDRIKDPEYLVTYQDKTALLPLELALRHQAVEANEIDAISGATLSSQALLVIVGEAVTQLRQAIGK
jgi:Na+-transporting NADH:ubiquinone oxidoreductase subunit C